MFLNEGLVCDCTSELESVQVAGQIRPRSQTGPGHCDEAGVGRVWELPHDRRKSGSSSCKTLEVN